ncbi:MULTISPECIES: hypothetical protein [Bacillus]|uniref:hypothetical protein n=1 Tax=Bacillus TaxID=1386 RepID=UPI00040DF85F|nr:MULTISPECIES: hypothetical protein [Bacillus]QHZ46001.1 hypothetical protein M654_006720 [Bacillus sp. NSP9.1]
MSKTLLVKANHGTARKNNVVLKVENGCRMYGGKSCSSRSLKKGTELGPKGNSVRLF